MLGDFGAGCRGDERSAAGDVEGLRATAAGANAIDELRSFFFGKGQCHGVPAHDVDEAGQLGSLFAARDHNGEERGDFDFGHASGEDLLEHLGRLGAGESSAVFGERAKQILYERHAMSISERARFRDRGT